MDVRFSLALPRAAYTVPVMRRVVGDTLRALGVAEECLDDILIASSEACTNVVDHGVSAHGYELNVLIRDSCCILEIVNEGSGFDLSRVPPAAPDAESGRGIALMRALVDDVSFVRDDGARMAVCLEKRVRWRDDRPGELVGAVSRAS
ncbi:ATP-binding protein [Allonocardiopsis opalescens]|uniref:Serine/threonine-protein kinase RsbW n=1 Tax=Allonocardiopsis opalescens TaxID=1144618 RepID=A0A2T0QAR6_9ACTN|nr:ATP-binding protein [Allonocardiopsis opalescens]PRY00937.1 serine/threonine-protein kinase RsbW [Allonocardiopsis opalescens]